MGTVKNFRLCVVLVLFGLVSLVYSAENGTDGETIGTEALIKLGRQLHKPMLTLIGMAIRNLHKCDQWSEWTPCSATKLGYFGSQERSRSCFRDNEVTVENDTSSMSNIEHEYKICEGSCRDDYNMTSHGYCMKLVEDAKTFDEAQKTCVTIGGHLIRINTNGEYLDLVSLLSEYSSRIFIGGKRQSVLSDWDFDPEVVDWKSGEPSGRNDELCMYLHDSGRKKADIECDEKYGFVCEIDV
ncbi:hypothetical protein ACF0H5_021850 [Mactra antiquata]